MTNFEYIILILTVIILLIFSISIIKITEYCVAFNNPKISIKKTDEISNKYNLVIVAIFKNEEDYLEEWLQHHIDQGISHFYLYNNDPKIEKYTYLDKYKDYITMTNWIDKVNKVGETIQMQAYSHCVKNFNEEYKFIMVLDIDEFLVSTDDKLTAIQIFNKLNQNLKAVKVERYDYGSDGHIIKPSGKVVDNYFLHEKICSSYKTIANSEYINTNAKFYGVHDFPLYNNDAKIYNKHFSYEYTGFPQGCILFPNIKSEVNLRIKHYFTKSYDEYIKRCSLWQNGGVHNTFYRKNCEATFIEKNKKMSAIK